MKSDFQNKNFLSTKKELKLSLEAMTQCAAGCAGCFLTPELRAKSNLWDLEKLKKAGTFAKKFIQEHTNQKIDDLILNFGQGDYLMLNEREIVCLLDEVCTWFPGKSSLYFTSSGVTKHQTFKNSLDLFYDKTTSCGLPLNLSIVLDSSKLQSKFLSIYEQNISYAKEKIGILDLHMNLGQDVIENISPVALDNFLKTNLIKFMTINFAPSYHSNLDKASWHAINDWLLEWLAIWHPDNYELNFINTIRHHFGAFADNNDLTSQLLSSTEVAKREVFIDYEGNAYTQQEGIGDVVLSNRNGFSSFMSIFDNKDILPLMQIHQQHINKQLIKSFTRANSCSQCDYSKVCTQLGVLAMKNTLGFDAKSSGCDLNLPTLLNAVLTRKDNEQLKTIGDDFAKIRVQKGLVNNHLALEAIDYDTAPVILGTLAKSSSS